MKLFIKYTFCLLTLLGGLSQSLNAQVVSLQADTLGVTQSETDPELFFVDITTVNFTEFAGIDVTFKISGATLDSIEVIIPGESFLTQDFPLADTARRLTYGTDNAEPITLADGTVLLRLWVRGNLGTSSADLNICIAEAVIVVDGIPSVAEVLPEFGPITLMFNPNRDFAGRVLNLTGEPLAGVPVRIDWGVDSSRTTVTDDEGNYTFTELPIAESYVVTPLGFPTESSRAERIDGINIADLVILSRHLIGIQLFTENWQFLAADVSGDNEIGLIDILTIQSYILARQDDFGAVDYWRFYPAGFEFGENAFNPAPPPSITLDGMPASTEDLDFIGLKRGDVNGSGND